jgi:hypothetical protein
MNRKFNATSGAQGCVPATSLPQLQKNKELPIYLWRAVLMKMTTSFMLLVCSALLLISPGTNAQSLVQLNPEQSRIVSLENAWNEAVQQKNGAALTMLLGPELVYIDYDGKLMDQAEYLASVLSPTVHPARVVSESMHVHLYGAAVVVEGVYRENGAKNGKAYMLRERFMDTWVRRGESWVCVASVSTLLQQ